MVFLYSVKEGNVLRRKEDNRETPKKGLDGHDQNNGTLVTFVGNGVNTSLDQTVDAI